MARFSSWVEVVASDAAPPTADAGPSCPGPLGHLLADVLAESGGRYEVVRELPSMFREDIARAAEVTADPELAAVARQDHVTMSPEHLRQYDPVATRIHYGLRLEREESDGVWWEPSPRHTR